MKIILYETIKNLLEKLFFSAPEQSCLYVFATEIAVIPAFIYFLALLSVYF